MSVKRWMKTAVACAVVIGALTTYKIMEIQAAIAFGESYPEHSETVVPVKAVLQDYRKTVQVLGEIMSPQQVQLRSELPGRIVEVGFRSGEKVANNQLLLQLDVGEELAQLDSAKAQLELAKSVFQRNSALRQRNAVSQEQLDRARADLATVKAEITLLQSTLRKKTIRAPFAGLTGIHQFEVGAFLLDNVLVTDLVGEQDYLWVDFSLPQFYPLLDQGAQVEVATISHTAETPWVMAEIVARNSVISTKNRSFRYRAKLKRAAFSVAVNSAVTVKVPVTQPRQLLAIPVASLQTDNLGEFVFLLEKNTQAEGFRAVRQQVKVLGRQGGQVLLKNDVALKQLMAGAGAFKLYPGLLVFSQERHVQQGGSTAGES